MFSLNVITDTIALIMHVHAIVYIVALLQYLFMLYESFCNVSESIPQITGLCPVG